jgi:phage-related protein
MASILGGLGGGREYVLKIVADVKDAIKGVDDVEQKTSSMKDKMVGIGKAAATGLAAAAVVKFGTDSVQAAADADDAADMIASAFGDAGKELDSFAKNAATNMGLSETAYKNMAATTGQILTGFGLSQQDAAKRTEDISQRAADIAAIWGISVQEASDVINAGITGSTKGLKKFGIALSDSEISARAMKDGYVDASGKVTDAGKAIARQELILEKTSKYQGEFAKNSGDLGSQQDILKAKFENLQTSIGEKLLPVILKLFDVIKPLINFISSNTSWLVPLAAGILAIVGAVKLWNIAQIILNSTLLANPIFQVIAVIAALTAGIIWAYNNVGWFRDAVDGMAHAVVASFNWIKDTVVGVFNWIRDNWPLLLAILTGPFGIVVDIIIKNWDTIKGAIMGVFNWIKENWGLLLVILMGPFGLLVGIIIKNFDAIKGVIESAIGWIANIFSTVFGIISTPFVQAFNYVAPIIMRIVDIVRNMVGAIVRVLSPIPGYIAGPFNAAWNWLVGFANGVLRLFNGLVTGIGRVFAGIADSIVYPFRVAFDAIKWLWNRTIGGFGFTTPSWLPPPFGGRSFEIPEMATGGIVTKPTIALIGEAGPEAVVPLSGSYAPVTMQQQPVVINVYALTASSEVGRQVYNALREYERVSGKAIS